MWPENGFDTETLAGLKAHLNGAVVGAATMHRFGWKVGQNVILLWSHPVTLPFTIVGSYSGGNDPSVFMFRRDYLEAELHDSMRVDMMWVRLADSRVAGRVAGQIDATFRDSPAETETDTEKAFLTTFLVRFQSLGRIVQAVGLCAVFAIALAVLNGASMTLRERRAEIAVLRTVGFLKSQIIAMLMIEALLIAMIGGIGGAAAAALILDLVRGGVPALGPTLRSRNAHSDYAWRHRDGARHWAIGARSDPGGAAPGLPIAARGHLGSLDNLIFSALRV